MVVKIDGLNKEQFAALTVFLASEDNLIYPPEGKVFSTSNQVPFASIRRAVQEVSGVLLEAKAVLDITVSLRFGNIGGGGNGNLIVPQSYLLQLFGTIDLFPPEEPQD